MIDIAHFADVIHSLEYTHFIRNGRYASTLNQTPYSSIEIQNGEKNEDAISSLFFAINHVKQQETLQ